MASYPGSEPLSGPDALTTDWPAALRYHRRSWVASRNHMEAIASAARSASLAFWFWPTMR